jgi:hypothetical protein
MVAEGCGGFHPAFKAIGITITIAIKSSDIDTDPRNHGDKSLLSHPGLYNKRQRQRRNGRSRSRGLLLSSTRHS